MSARHVIYSPATCAGLTAALEVSPPHLRPIIEAVRDHRVGMCIVEQSAEPFCMPRDPSRSAIVLIGDDFDRAVGPGGFHLPSVRRAIRSCHAFAIVSSAPLVAVYKSVALTAALTRRNVMLVETRPEQEIPWLSVVQKLAPGRFVWLATVAGGRA